MWALCYWSVPSLLLSPVTFPATLMHNLGASAFSVFSKFRFLCGPGLKLALHSKFKFVLQWPGCTYTYSKMINTFPVAEVPEADSLPSVPIITPLRSLLLYFLNRDVHLVLLVSLCAACYIDALRPKGRKLWAHLGLTKFWPLLLLALSRILLQWSQGITDKNRAGENVRSGVAQR